MADFHEAIGLLELDAWMGFQDDLSRFCGS